MVDLAQVVEGNVGVSEEATVDDKRPRADNLPSRLGLGVEGEASLITRELAELPGALSARPGFKACGAYGGDRKEHEEPLEELDKVLVVGVLAPHLIKVRVRVRVLVRVRVRVSSRGWFLRRTSHAKPPPFAKGRSLRSRCSWLPRFI